MGPPGRRSQPGPVSAQLSFHRPRFVQCCALADLHHGPDAASRLDSEHSPGDHVIQQNRTIARVPYELVANTVYIINGRYAHNPTNKKLPVHDS